MSPTSAAGTSAIGCRAWLGARVEDCRRARNAGVTEQPAFYCVADARYFLGAVGLINSLRLNGHREPIYLLDCGLSDEQRELLAARGDDRRRPPPRRRPTCSRRRPARHPAEVMVLIDVDMIVSRSLGELIERAAEGRIVAFGAGYDRFVAEWAPLLGLGELRRHQYVTSRAPGA